MNKNQLTFLPSRSMNTIDSKDPMIMTRGMLRLCSFELTVILDTFKMTGAKLIMDRPPFSPLQNINSVMKIKPLRHAFCLTEKHLISLFKPWENQVYFNL